MIRCYYGVVVLAFFLILVTPTLGSGNVQQENQRVLTESKIKKSSIKKALQDIKKTLSGELRNCPIEVIDVKLLKYDESDGDVGENWTVKVCQDEKEYLITTFHPKGYYCTVVPKQEQLAKEIKTWNAAKKHNDEDYWRDVLFYIDEIEAMDKNEK